jgi:hypothetical protein
MNRLMLLVTLFALLSPGWAQVTATQYQLTIDATKQPSPPARGRGPWPGSSSPGHSADLPIQIDLLVPTGELRPDGIVLGTTPVDFVITNIGTKPITLPISVNHRVPATSVLTLYLTSDAIADRDFQSTSAELRGDIDDPQSFYVLSPHQSILVHASSRVRLQGGTHSLTAHAELLRLSHGSSELVGTADSHAIRKLLQ